MQAARRDARAGAHLLFEPIDLQVGPAPAGDGGHVAATPLPGSKPIPSIWNRPFAETLFTLAVTRAAGRRTIGSGIVARVPVALVPSITCHAPDSHVLNR